MRASRTARAQPKRPPQARLRGQQIRILRAGQALARLPPGARGTAARAQALVQRAAAFAAALVRMGGRSCPGRRSRGRHRHRGSTHARRATPAVHRALLAGFCTMVGVRGEEGEYLGHARRSLPYFPGLAAAAPQAALGDGREHRRNIAGVCAACRGDRTDVDRGRRPAFVEARISRARLGRGARGGGRARARQFARSDLEREPHRELRPDRAGGIAADICARGVGLSAACSAGPIGCWRMMRPFVRHSGWRSGCACAVSCSRPELFVEFYAAALPRQVSSAATLEYFTRHLSAPQRRALALQPEQIFARSPDPAAARAVSRHGAHEWTSACRSSIGSPRARPATALPSRCRCWRCRR